MGRISGQLHGRYVCWMWYLQSTVALLEHYKPSYSPWYVSWMHILVSTLGYLEPRTTRSKRYRKSNLRSYRGIHVWCKIKRKKKIKRTNEKYTCLTTAAQLASLSHSMGWQFVVFGIFFECRHSRLCFLLQTYPLGVNVPPHGLRIRSPCTSATGSWFAG